MNIFIIKIIACITMIVDHIQYLTPTLTYKEFYLYVGRISFPLFAFITSESIIHTHDIKKYIKRMFIFAIVSQIPFMLFRTLVGNWKILNIGFTFLIPILAIALSEKTDNKLLKLFIYVLACLLGKLIHVDYDFYGIAYVILFYVFRNNKIEIFISYLLNLLVHFYFLGYDFKDIIVIKYFIAHLIPLLFIFTYNGKEGKKIKYFYYWFYPIHMFLIYILNFIFIK